MYPNQGGGSGLDLCLIVAGSMNKVQKCSLQIWVAFLSLNAFEEKSPLFEHFEIVTDTQC
jgi:hypothetical protein